MQGRYHEPRPIRGETATASPVRLLKAGCLLWEKGAGLDEPQTGQHLLPLFDLATVMPAVMAPWGQLSGQGVDSRGAGAGGRAPMETLGGGRGEQSGSCAQSPGGPELLPHPPTSAPTSQHLLRGQAQLHRPALPRCVPACREGRRSGLRSLKGSGLGKGSPVPSAHTLLTVPGSWCPWSEWTACSQPCRGQARTRSRACACPAPQHGGDPCPGEAGAQHQREACRSPAVCPGVLPA